MVDHQVDHQAVLKEEMKDHQDKDLLDCFLLQEHQKDLLSILDRDSDRLLHNSYPNYSRRNQRSK